MKISVRQVVFENIKEEMEPCLEDVPQDKRKDWTPYCQQKIEWFKDAQEKYGTCAFVAYLNGRPASLVEFLPVEAVPYPEKRPPDTFFVLCFYTRRDSQRKGVGRKLIEHLINYLKNTPIKYFQGRKAAAIEVYVPEIDPKWPAYIQFPTGSKDFYEKFGFEFKKKLPKQDGYLYRLELGR